MMKRSPAFPRQQFRRISTVLGVSLVLTAHIAFAQTADTASQLPRKDQKVPVAFGEQSSQEVLQARGQVNGTALESVPVGQLEGALYGKLAGLYLIQSSGRPGNDQPGILLRGQAPLVVIDGVPRTFTSIDPQQIESITVLKDALATALYGQRAANGVLLIKTRRGTIAPKKISFTVQTAIQQPLKQPSFVNAYDYARLFNEALVNDGKMPVYSQDDLNKYRDHSNPFTHPDVDWYGTVLKDQATALRYNLNVSGGTNMARYFVDLDYMNQQGFFITDNKLNSYPTNNFYKRYGFRSNVDLQVSKSTLLSLNIFGRIRNGNEPGAGTDAIYENLVTTPNNAYPVFNENGSLGGNNQYSNNIYGQVLRSGYRPTYNRNLGVDVSVRQDLGFVKGLYVKGFASFNSYYSQSINRSKTFAVYDVNVNPVSGDTTVQKIGSDAAQSNSSSITSQNRQIYAEFSAGYDWQRGPHTLHAQLLFNRDNYVAESDLPLNNYGFAGRVQYNYNEQYFAELAASYMAMNRYPENNQWGFFPAVGLGWNMARAKWFHVPVIDALKWRVTYGQTGDNSGAGYFVYQQFYDAGSSFYFQNPSTSAGTLVPGTLANPNITWEKASKFNVGVDLALFNNKVELSVDYFVDRYYDLLQQRRTNASNVAGIVLPQENIGKQSQRGLEISLGYTDKKGDLGWFVQANVSFRKSKQVFMDEGRWPHDYLKRTGLPVAQPFGLTAIGFYQSQDDIDNSPAVEGYNPVPGDLKFRDTNKDGIINLFDETALGTTRPLFFYGLTAGVNWKGFDLSVLFNGVGNRYVFTNNSRMLEFQQNDNGGYGQVYTHHLNRWTPATAATATYPRLSLGDNSNNNRNSSFWLKNGSYLRLRNAELGYTLPQRWLSFAGISKFRAFVNAVNLLTITPLEEVDPEVVNGGYPNQRVINFGINIQF